VGDEGQGNVAELRALAAAAAAAAAMLTLLLQVIPEDVRATVLNLFR
jgi:hypothetical protein